MTVKVSLEPPIFTVKRSAFSSESEFREIQDIIRNIQRAHRSAADAINQLYFPADWTALSLQNSWVNYGAPYNTAEYCKVGAFVHLKGLIKDGTFTPGTVIATLPIGYRPEATYIFSVIGPLGPSRIDINISGDIIVSSSPSNIWLSLDGLTFRAL